MIDLSQYKKLVIGGVELKKLAVNGVEVWSSYTNWVPLSVNADGTIYNNGLGYKNGYRIRSGGLESEHGGTSCTGFIKVNAGDVIRWFPVNENMLTASGNSINVYDSGFNNLGQAASNGAYGIIAGAYSSYSWGNGCVNEGGGVYRWTVPPAASGVAYIRISIYDNTNGGIDGANMIITVNEEIA